MIEIVFLAVGYHDKYEKLLCSYTACVLENVPNSAVEIIVIDPESFSKKYSDTLFILHNSYPNRIIIRGQSFKKKVIPNSVRFYEVPQIKAPYTYIGDIDIFITDSNVLKVHKQIMDETGFPYSNKVRGSGIKLTGLQCVKTEEYYTPKFREAQRRYLEELDHKTMDEIALFQMCKEVFGLTPNKKRPIHGIHVSYRRKYNEIKIKGFQTFVNNLRRSKKLYSLAKACPDIRETFIRVGDEMEKAFDNGWLPDHREAAAKDVSFLKSL